MMKLLIMMMINMMRGARWTDARPRVRVLYVHRCGRQDCRWGNGASRSSRLLINPKPFCVVSKGLVG